jgi:RHS repeat-associated protein
MSTMQRASVCLRHHKFTGKERDSESGLDFFGARFYSSTMGRWFSPDWSATPEPVPYADLGNPQSLNLYGYVRNNPMSFADYDGHCWNWAQRICNTGQRFDNAFHGFGFHTDKQVNAIVENDRKWLRENTSFSPAQQERLTDKQALAIYNGFQNHQKTVVSDKKKWTLQAVGSLPYGTPLSRDMTGKIHGDLPDHVPDNWKKEDLELARDELAGWPALIIFSLFSFLSQTVGAPFSRDVCARAG